MKTNEFNKVVDELVAKINTTLKKKAAEYNLDDDRLSVFKRAAAIQHETAPQALLGMMMKHVVSICDYVAEDKKFTRDLALEKFGDNLNYLILLFALLQEEGFADSKEEKEVIVNAPFVIESDKLEAAAKENSETTWTYSPKAFEEVNKKRKK